MTMKDVLHINTSDLVGRFTNCGSSSRLNYHFLRKVSVYEFNAESQMVVGTHNFVGSAPIYPPFVSTNSVRIIVIGMNGDKVHNAGTPGF